MMRREALFFASSIRDGWRRILSSVLVSASIGFATAPVLAADGGGGVDAASGQGTESAGRVQSELKQFRVVAIDGKEQFQEAATVRPGDTIEYRLTYTNNGRSAVTHLAATFPISTDLRYVARSASPIAQAAAADGMYGAEPLTRKAKNGGASEVVPYAEYRSLRWQIGELKPGATVTLKVRARVAAQDGALEQATADKRSTANDKH